MRTLRREASQGHMYCAITTTPSHQPMNFYSVHQLQFLAHKTRHAMEDTLSR